MSPALGPSKWCAGCHDHAVFFNGRFDRPIKEQIGHSRSPSRARMHVLSRHRCTWAVPWATGDFTVEYPPLHELASSPNPFIQALDRFLIYLNPKPHRATFLKPFMREQAAEFCASCHKVHLDVPVNNYRWVRGFDDYDNWQASGVSGQGARSFYYPTKSQSCADCHMPLVASHDPGNSRRPGTLRIVFLAQIRPLRLQIGDDSQLKDRGRLPEIRVHHRGYFRGIARRRSHRNHGHASTQRLASNQHHVRRRRRSRAARRCDNSRGWQDRGPRSIRPERKLEPGSTVRVDVVVRTRKIGHFFPGGNSRRVRCVAGTTGP